MNPETDRICREIREIALPIAQDWGLDLLEVEYRPGPGRALLRLTLHRPGGRVGIEDCERVSRELEPHLEVADLMPGPYQLEVSSPGLTRPLKAEEDFVRFSKNLVKIYTTEPIEGHREFKGTLVGAAEGVVHVAVEGREVSLPLTKIAKANLEVEF